MPFKYHGFVYDMHPMHSMHPTSFTTYQLAMCDDTHHSADAALCWPPPPPPVATLKSVPMPPSLKRSPAPNLKSMMLEEWTAFIHADAQQYVQERMHTLGVASPSSMPTVDSSVEDHLATDCGEAEEKARQAEKDAEEHERLRKEGWSQ